MAVTSSSCGPSAPNMTRCSRSRVPARSRLQMQIFHPADWSALVSTYSPELIRTMRAVLEEAVSKLPADRATSEIKAHMAGLILKAAAEGETTHRGLLEAVSKHLSRLGSVPM